MEIYMKKIFNEAIELAKRKNKDYTGDKIDNIALTGAGGISVRLIDKVARLYNLTHTEGKPNFESTRDTMVDIINYACFGIMIEEGSWGMGKKDFTSQEDQLREVIDERQTTFNFI